MSMLVINKCLLSDDSASFKKTVAFQLRKEFTTMKSLLLKLFTLWLVGNASPTDVQVQVDIVHEDLYTGNNGYASIGS